MIFSLLVIVILHLALAILLITNRFFNELNLRTLLIPETDDVDESTRNARQVNNLSTLVRGMILFIALVIFTGFFIFFESYFWGNLGTFYKTSLSFLISLFAISATVLMIHFSPISLVKKLIFVAKGSFILLSKIYRMKFWRTRTNGRDKSDEENGDELDVFEAAGLSVDSDEMKMIKGILKMDIVRVREIMIPRVDMVTAENSSSITELAGLIASSGYSKIPVIGENIDEIRGIVYAKDILKTYGKNSEHPSISTIQKQATFVPEAQNLEQLLAEFQKKRTRMAIVVDEHGGVSGLVTVTDLIEEIVGELMDEFDQPKPTILRMNGSNLIADAGVSISDINEEIGTSIQIDGYDTIGGLLYRELGKMPVVGDSINFEGLNITIQSTVGRRIGKLRIKII